MAMQVNTGDDGMMAELNVTPLVDVMLVLLVIFIITAPLIVPQSLKVTLPKTQVVASQDDNKQLVLVVSASGGLTLDGREVTDTEFSQRIRDVAAKEPTKALQLQADERVPYGRIASVMAIAQNSGLTRLAFITLPK